MMSQLMILPNPAMQKDFTEFVFSELFRSFPLSAGPDLSWTSDCTMGSLTSMINQTLLRGKYTSKAAERPEHRPQEAAHKISGQVKYEQQHSMPASVQPDFTDACLVEQAATGNERAFELLVQRYEMPIKQFVHYHLARTEDTQDIVQFVFLQLYLFLPRLRGRLISTHSQQPLKSWLLQVARNRCHDERRKQRLFLFSEMETITEEENSLLEHIPDTAPLPEDSVEEHDQQRLLQKAIQALPPRYRSIVSLRYREELTFREIAGRLNIPENTAKTYFRRARPLLRSALASLER